MYYQIDTLTHETAFDLLQTIKDEDCHFIVLLTTNEVRGE